jgi:hypothetical protein
MPRGGEPLYCAVCGHKLVDAKPAGKRWPHSTPPRGSVPPAASAALQLAFCSLIPFVGLLFGVMAIILGRKAQVEIGRSNGRMGGLDVASRAIALATFTTVVWLLACLGVFSKLG